MDEVGRRSITITNPLLPTPSFYCSTQTGRRGDSKAARRNHPATCHPVYPYSPYVLVTGTLYSRERQREQHRFLFCAFSLPIYSQRERSVSAQVRSRRQRVVRLLS